LESIEEKKREEIRELKRRLKSEWKELWTSKYDDRLMAEGISRIDRENLFVSKGEVLYTNKQSKQTSLKEILEKHVGPTSIARYDPDPWTGGWGKFIKTKLPSQETGEKKEAPRAESRKYPQKRKSGSGWLNRSRYALREL
jgi:hypothetical protein